MSETWGYDVENGPATWSRIYPQAAGPRQSPVDITTSTAVADESLKDPPLSWSYVAGSSMTITNPGYGWRVDVNTTECEITGGPLRDTKYRLEQFHSHWGCDTGQGSEHTVDGRSYPAELHLVHWNYNKYQNILEAAQNPDGLCVFGIFLEVGTEDHPELEKVVSAIGKVPYKDETAEIEGTIDPALFLPEKMSYWTYLGSLTTPPCYESVTWIVFKDPISVSERQLEVFRNLRSCACGADDAETRKVVQNYRPALSLGKRELKECLY